MTAEKRTEARMARICGVLSRRQKDLTLVLANIHDPHNVSAIYRSCDAFGVGRVHLYYTETVFPVLGSKSSASARKWVESVRHKEARAMAEVLQAQSMTVMATSFSPRAIPVVEHDFTKPTAVILGNEHRGVDKELLDLAHGEIYVPMQGMVQSLNVSVAAAVILFEAWRQRSAAGLFDSPSLPPDELQAMISAWSAK